MGRLDEIVYEKIDNEAVIETAHEYSCLSSHKYLIRNHETRLVKAENLSQTSTVKVHIDNVLIDDVILINTQHFVKEKSYNQQNIGEEVNMDATKTTTNQGFDANYDFLCAKIIM